MAQPGIVPHKRGAKQLQRTENYNLSSSPLLSMQQPDISLWREHLQPRVGL